LFDVPVEDFGSSDERLRRSVSLLIAFFQKDLSTLLSLPLDAPGASVPPSADCDCCIFRLCTRHYNIYRADGAVLDKTRLRVIAASLYRVAKSIGAMGTHFLSPEQRAAACV